MTELLGIEYFFNTHQRVFWLYLLSSLSIALIYMYFHKGLNLFSRDIWWHQSAKIDYGYFIVVSVIKVVVIIPLLLSSKEVSVFTVILMQQLFGYVSALDWSREMILFTFSLTLFLVSDFTRYWLHRLMHSIPLLWRFHRVHHSAEVLNPLTFYRIHPVENFLFGLRYALSAGVITGIFIYFFGARIGLIEIIGVNIFVFVFALAGSNLRHSHVPIRFGYRLEKWFISPYMHQLHHAKKTVHTNFGGALAIWDRMFKTLYVNQVQALEFGVNEPTNHHSIIALIIEPFKKEVIV
ncbi:MAG: sterol desaturase family protein [Campylobacterota bacterium]|nr:sterol desaturase family protein [Campylobacterota bacterium]